MRQSDLLLDQLVRADENTFAGRTSDRIGIDGAGGEDRLACPDDRAGCKAFDGAECDALTCEGECALNQGDGVDEPELLSCPGDLTWGGDADEDRTGDAEPDSAALIHWIAGVAASVLIFVRRPTD